MLQAKELLECIFEVHHFQKQVYHQLYYLPWQEEGSLPRIRETIRRETGVSTYLEEYIVFQIPEKVCELITYLKSELFARKCRQILAIALHTANTCTAIQIASLKTLSEVLEANIDFFYQIFGTRRMDLKLYEDLSGIPLKLLGDDDLTVNMETLWEPEMYRMLKEIADVGSFFQTLVLRLFRCLKFSTGERLMLVARCLGLLGAIDCKFLGFEQLSLSDSYEVSLCV